MRVGVTVFVVPDHRSQDGFADQPSAVGHYNFVTPVVRFNYVLTLTLTLTLLHNNHFIMSQVLSSYEAGAVASARRAREPGTDHRLRLETATCHWWQLRRGAAEGGGHS